MKTAQSEAGSSQVVKPEDIRAALLQIREEELPKTQEEKEQYFLKNVEAGERMCMQGRCTSDLPALPPHILFQAPHCICQQLCHSTGRCVYILPL